MAAMLVKALCFLSILLLVNSIFIIETAEARADPFNITMMKLKKGGSAASTAIEGFFDGLSLGAIKESGPSPGGGGHSYTNSQTLGGIKDSGPSPGQGHKFITGTHQ